MNFADGEVSGQAIQAAMEMPGDPLDVSQYGADTTWRANSEYIRMVSRYGDSSAAKMFDEYLKEIRMTPEAKAKLRNFYYETLNPLIVSTNIESPEQEQYLIALFNIAMREVTLGLTCFDINSGFHQIMILTRIHFVTELYKARRGKFFDRLTINRSEAYQFEGPVDQGRRSTLQQILSLGRRG